MAKMQLLPGEHSIYRVTPQTMTNAKGETYYRLGWAVRLHDGRVLNKQSQGKTKDRARQRALATAAKLLADPVTTWQPHDLLTDYMQAVSAPAIDKANLSPRSREKYHRALRYLAQGLAGKTIRTAMTYRVLETCLQQIADHHGLATANQVRSTLGTYVTSQLERDQLITASPIAGKRLRLTSSKPKPATSSQKTLTEAEYFAVRDFLVAADVSDVEAPKQGRWGLDYQIARRKTLYELALLQASTGLRIEEAQQLRWEHVTFNPDNTLTINVTAEIAKNSKARTVKPLYAGLYDVLAARLDRILPQSSWPVFGLPHAPQRVWDYRSLGRANEQFYAYLATQTNVTALGQPGRKTHIWRATLNTLTQNTLPQEVRAAYFGHTAAVNEAHYTDYTQGGALAPAIDALSRPTE